jgi:hypothetical protein
MIESLRTHRVNTLVELRRVEKAFATIGSADLNEPMTSACRHSPDIRRPRVSNEPLGQHYVHSNNLLVELRGLTKNYPFSSECLDEAKRRVYADPQSNRSWNLCWLVLTKMRTEYVTAMPQAPSRSLVPHSHHLIRGS